jgi:hypothetical protein
LVSQALKLLLTGAAFNSFIPFCGRHLFALVPAPSSSSSSSSSSIVFSPSPTPSTAMSTAETNKVKAKLAALVSSFDDLEAQLEPLFAQTLPETLVGLEPLQQAKLQTVLPYLVYDLIFSAYIMISCACGSNAIY